MLASQSVHARDQRDHDLQEGQRVVTLHHKIGCWVDEKVVPVTATSTAIIGLALKKVPGASLLANYFIEDGSEWAKSLCCGCGCLTFFSIGVAEMLREDGSTFSTPVRIMFGMENRRGPNVVNNTRVVHVHSE